MGNVLFSVLLFVVVISVCINAVALLQCLHCYKARTLSDCTTNVTCSADQECYMDELVIQRSIVYYGGCRPKTVCATGHSSFIGRRKRQATYTCKSCCNYGNNCNSRLCGIPTNTSRQNKCYSCDTESYQAAVSRPRDCVNLEYCQTDQVCYAGLIGLGGSQQVNFGCKSKLLCRLLMDRTFAAIKECRDDPDTCGNAKRAGTSVCHSCCGEYGCNSGSCIAMNQRLFALWELGVFDMSTMSVART